MVSTTENFEYILHNKISVNFFKIPFIVTSKVGKTNIVSKFFNATFSEKHLKTIGVNISIKK